MTGSETDPFTGLPVHLVEEHDEAMAKAIYNTRRDRFERWVSDLGRSLGNANDRLHRRRPERWDRRSWRLVDRVARRLYTFGER